MYAGICGPGTIPEYGSPTGAVPLNILVWPNAVAGSYPVCGISKYVGTLDLILKRYLRYLQLCSTATSARARSPDTGTTTRPGTTRGCLRTAHGFQVVHYLTQLITLPRPCLCLLKLGHRGSGTYPRQVSRAVRLHHIAKAKLHPLSKGTESNT